MEALFIVMKISPGCRHHNGFARKFVWFLRKGIFNRLTVRENLLLGAYHRNDEQEINLDLENLTPYSHGSKKGKTR